MASLKVGSKKSPGPCQGSGTVPYQNSRHHHTYHNEKKEREEQSLKSALNALQRDSARRRSHRRRRQKLCFWRTARIGLGIMIVFLMMMFCNSDRNWRIGEEHALWEKGLKPYLVRWMGWKGGGGSFPSRSSASFSPHTNATMPSTYTRPSMMNNHQYNDGGSSVQFTEHFLLSKAIHSFLELPSIPHMQSLVQHTVQVAQFLLDHLPVAAELESVVLSVHDEGEKGEAKKDSSSSPRKNRKGEEGGGPPQKANEEANRKEVEREMLEELHRSSLSTDIEKWVGEAEVPLLLDSTAILYAVLQSVLLSMPPPRLPALSFPPSSSTAASPHPSLGGDPLFPHVLTESPAMVYQWMAGTVFALNHVLPEFFARKTYGSGGGEGGGEQEKAEKEQETRHLSVLLQAINVEYWSQWRLFPALPGNFSTSPSSTPTPSSICEGLLENKNGRGGADPDGVGVESSSSSPSTAFSFPMEVHFLCRHSLYSIAAIARRVAANFEELIALHPRYGPFRLHYLSALRSWEAAALAGRHQNHRNNTSSGNSLLYDAKLYKPEMMEKRRAVIMRELGRSEQYIYSDAYHALLLRWMEVFTFPEDYNATSVGKSERPSRRRGKNRKEKEEEQRGKGQDSDKHGGAPSKDEEDLHHSPSPNLPTSSLEKVLTVEPSSTLSSSTSSLMLDILYSLPHCRVIMQPGLFPGKVKEGYGGEKNKRNKLGKLGRGESSISSSRGVEDGEKGEGGRHLTGDPSAWPGLHLKPVVQRPPLFTVEEVRSIMKTKRGSLPPKELESFLSC